jgi:hypothetical protein
MTGISPERKQELTQEIVEHLEPSYPAFDSLVERLAPSLQAKKYSTLLTDIRGGILPAVVIGGLTQRWADQNGSQPPLMVDLPGGKWWHTISHSEYLNNTRSLTSPGRSLVVTEVIAGGEASGRIYMQLQAAGIPVDVAALQTYCETDEYYRRWQVPGRWYGAIPEHVQVYRGTGKTAEGDLLSDPHLVLARSLKEDREQFFNGPEITVDEHRLLMDVARQQLEQLTDQLYYRHFPAT